MTKKSAVFVCDDADIAYSPAAQRSLGERAEFRFPPLTATQLRSDLSALSDVSYLFTGWSFINTSRGAVVREEEMIAVLTRRPNLSAMLELTDPEPPVSGSPLYVLPNVYLTPHIASSVANECWRMGEYMLAEFQRYLKGEPLGWQVTLESSKMMA